MCRNVLLKLVLDLDLDLWVCLSFFMSICVGSFTHLPKVKSGVGVVVSDVLLACCLRSVLGKSCFDFVHIMKCNSSFVCNPLTLATSYTQDSKSRYQFISSRWDQSRSAAHQGYSQEPSGERSCAYFFFYQRWDRTSTQYHKKFKQVG